MGKKNSTLQPCRTSIKQVKRARSTENCNNINLIKQERNVTSQNKWIVECGARVSKTDIELNWYTVAAREPKSVHLLVDESQLDKANQINAGSPINTGTSLTYL